MLRLFFNQAFFYHKGRSAAFKIGEFALMQLVYPLLTLVFYCLIASYSFRTTDLTSWVIGNAFLLCTNTCIFELGNIFNGERYWGRLRFIIASPCSKLMLILASGVFPAVFAAGASIIGFLVGVLLFHVDFSGVNLWLVAVTVLCAMVSATCFGLFVSTFGLITDSMHLILNVVSYMLIIFTGAEFPVSQLPLGGRITAQCMPLTKSISAMELLLKNDFGRFWIMLISEIVTGIIFALLAWAVFGIVERTSIKRGQLDIF